MESMVFFNITIFKKNMFSYIVQQKMIWRCFCSIHGKERKEMAVNTTDILTFLFIKAFMYML